MVIELTNDLYRLTRSVAGDVALLVLSLFARYTVTGLPLAGRNIFGSYPFSDFISLVTLALAWFVLLDVGEKVAPFLGSMVRKKYGGKRELNWDELAKATVLIAVLVTMWVSLGSQFQSLALSLGSVVNPNALFGLYTVLFGLAIAYYAVSGAIRSKAPKLKQQEALGDVPWDRTREAVQFSRYLKRLEALKSSGEIDETTYLKLRLEYETKLRQSIETP